MKIPDTITAKVREFYRWHTDSSYTADSEDLAAFLEQALLDVRRETEQEVLDMVEEWKAGEGTVIIPRDEWIKIKG